LSGAGKSTIARAAQIRLLQRGIESEIIDGDEYRETLCKDLTFSKNDRIENINRLAFVASKFSAHGIIAIICAINPYEEARKKVSLRYENVRTVYINCSIPVLQKRDTKGLYKKAFLSDDHPEKLKNLSGINDPFDIPTRPDLVINTERLSKEQCIESFLSFIISEYRNFTNAFKAIA